MNQQGSNILCKYDAIRHMNTLGDSHIPFLFLIDFEMKAIQLFQLDNLPDTVLYDFRGAGNSPIMKKEKEWFSFQKFPITFEAYNHAFNILQRHIHNGNTFLANLTFPTPIETNLTLRDIHFYCSARYKILYKNDFVCFSPETFVTIHNGIISTFPMKGTMKVHTPGSVNELLASQKEIAEHSTVVDLLRNDLSMVADNVKVTRFRYVDKIRTHDGELLQVSSEITGELPDGYHSRIGEILFALLPAGSVTGAPKQKTVDVIREAEKADRGYYTGIGGIFDGNNLDSAVLIRFIENHSGKMHFRSGGGITFLSDVRSEYHELIDKVYVPIARDNQGKG
jgi:para-aminobenzoate synthetase component 1